MKGTLNEAREVICSMNITRAGSHIESLSFLGGCRCHGQFLAHIREVSEVLPPLEVSIGVQYCGGWRWHPSIGRTDQRTPHFAAFTPRQCWGDRHDLNAVAPSASHSQRRHQSLRSQSARLPEYLTFTDLGSSFLLAQAPIGTAVSWSLRAAHSLPRPRRQLQPPERLNRFSLRHLEHPQLL